MRLKHILIGSAALSCILGLSSAGNAHFGVIVPSDDVISQDDSKKLQVELKFIHPLEMHSMDLAKPKQFGVFTGGKKIDLLSQLTEAKTNANSPKDEKKFTFWKTTYQITRPGDYTFYMEPTPYYEPAEESFIVHYTKVCVNALGLEGGWDEPVGLETEIIPLTRPYGFWTNNIFTGQVLLKGKPVAGTPVEIEYLNESPGNRKVVKAPNDAHVTQVVKTDANGVFSYAMPRAGWWGFAALSEAEWKLKHEGVEKAVEIGAVFWVHTVDMK